MSIKTKTRVYLLLICCVFFIMISAVTFQVSASDKALTKEVVRDLIDKTFVVMQEHYIEPDVVQSLKEVIVTRLELGKYSNLNSLEDYASVVGRDIRIFSDDDHLSLFTVAPKEEITHVLQHSEGKLTYNYAFEEVRYLDGNIGYLKFNKFYSDDNALQVADAAFEFLKSSDGMIIDLRDTVGGSSYLVQHMLGYFLPLQTPLWETFDKHNKQIESVVVTEHSSHTKFHTNYPVWILTSRHSASATELFSGVLQANSKAKIIGETTSGAGFYVGVRQITAELVFRISLSKIVISASQKSWEKTGLTPSVEVPAIDAMEQARKAIYEAMLIKEER